MTTSELCVSRHSQTRSVPGAGKAEEGWELSIKVMIGTATVDLHVTLTTGYEERHQWGGREDASAAVFIQWLNACESSPKIPNKSRLGSLGSPQSLSLHLVHMGF